MDSIVHQGDTVSQHDCNQRYVLLFGVGKKRDEKKHAVKKMAKGNFRSSGIIQFYSKKKQKSKSIFFPFLFVQQRLVNCIQKSSAWT